MIDADDVIRHDVLVYAGEGTSATSVKQTTRAILFICNCPVDTITADELIAGAWMQRTRLLVMPGGRDLLYCNSLNGLGNELIKEFVELGGSYLGICAGAYFASAECVFDRGGPLQVIGPRELAFFPDAAVGPVLSHYSYQTFAHVRAARVLWYLNADADSCTSKEAMLYFHGGCTFHNAHMHSEVEVLATYANQKAYYAGVLHDQENQCGNDPCIDQVTGVCSKPVVTSAPVSAPSPTHAPAPAIICVSAKRGLAVLSGVHIEYDPHCVELEDQLMLSKEFDRGVLSDLRRCDGDRQLILRTVLQRLGVKVKNL